MRARRVASPFVLATVGCALALASGCSSSNLPPFIGDDDPATSGEGSGGADAGVDSALGLAQGATTSTALTCNLGPDGGVCACTDVTPLGTPPNMFFVLDRSASMAESDKWNTVRTVVSQIVTSIGPRAYFGAALFPAPNSANQCSTGEVVFPLAQGDSPAGTYGPTATALYQATNVYPNGGTPTAATLTTLLPTLKTFKGKTYVILATDGGPNCSMADSCEASECIPNIESDTGCTPTGPTCCTPTTDGGENCLDSDASVQAIAALKASGFPVYVVGLPGSGPYAGVLDQFAQAGGTAQSTEPLYYAAASTNLTDIESALSKVAAKIVGSCTVTLGTAPANPNLVNVYLDNTVLPQDPTNGWSISGSTVTLLGTACSEVLAGDILDVRVVAGCPTVLR